MPVYQRVTNFYFCYQSGKSRLCICSREHFYGMFYRTYVKHLLTPWLQKTKQDAAGLHTSTDNTTVFILSNKEQDLHTFHPKEMLMQKTQKTKRMAGREHPYLSQHCWMVGDHQTEEALYGHLSL